MYQRKPCPRGFLSLVYRDGDLEVGETIISEERTGLKLIEIFIVLEKHIR
jgi:hypothetical protein